MKVLVMGNGFDLAHGLNSTWNSFKNYLNYNDKELHDLLDEIFNKENWSDFENSLREKGLPKFYEIIEDVEVQARFNGELEFEVDQPSTYENGHHIFMDEMETQKWLPEKINKHLLNWIRGEERYNSKLIDIDIKSYDLIISFNYTSYWVNKYRYENKVLYLHGSIEGSNTKTGFFDKVPNLGSINTGSNYWSQDRSSYTKMFNKVNWHIFKHIKKYKPKELHFFGLSFGEQDIHYIKQLLKSDSTNVSIFERSEEKYLEKVAALKSKIRVNNLNFNKINFIE